MRSLCIFERAIVSNKGHLKLEPETLYIAVKLLDATLQSFKVGVSRLQLCGLAVFWLAAKLESTSLNASDTIQEPSLVDCSIAPYSLGSRFAIPHVL